MTSFAFTDVSYIRMHCIHYNFDSHYTKFQIENGICFEIRKVLNRFSSSNFEEFQFNILYFKLSIGSQELEVSN